MLAATEFDQVRRGRETSRTANTDRERPLLLDDLESLLFLGSEEGIIRAAKVCQLMILTNARL
jgi:hypothetical protein